MQTLRKNQKEHAELKDTIHKTENSSEGLNGRVGSAEEKISNLENKAIEVIVEIKNKK